MVNPVLRSMTGFAARRGRSDGYDWLWDIRSVNGKGLDLRLRLPDWIEGLEPAIRARLSAALGRGNVALSLKVDRAAAGEAPRVNLAALDAALAGLALVRARAKANGITLADPTAADILAMRGVTEGAAAEEDQTALLAALLSDADALVAALVAMRESEGAALAAIITGQLDRIAALVAEAGEAATARRPEMQRQLDENLARVLAGAAADPDRVAQELAMLVVKADVIEELDRLNAHVAAARKLLAEAGAIGRKFDFLMQEFMREANTLCSKSGNAALTRIGLDLKTVIDQMREQVQNVE
ncbi:MAG: YicC family protein [Proteobacteria bacterium]|nr:YicC family protein [Pseudomonadota bacterium]